MSVRGRPLDAQETAQLAELLGRGLPPHHALYRTARAWYVYRWDEGKGKFCQWLSDASLASLLSLLHERV